MKSVLIVEDDPAFSSSIARVIKEQFEPLQTSSGREALILANRRKPDLILLDLNLPDAHGAALCKQLRNHLETRAIPIIMITGEMDPETRIECLETGADDYLCKPFNLRELLARIRVQLRRQETESRRDQELRFANLLLDVNASCAWIDDAPVPLTRFELKMLHYFVERAGKLVERSDCLSDLWPQTTVSERTVDTHVARLRRKLKGFRGELRTVYRGGYRLESRDGSAADHPRDERPN